MALPNNRNVQEMEPTRGAGIKVIALKAGVE